MLSPETYAAAKILWEYHHMNHELEKSDCILALGSHDVRVAERASELYLQGWAPLVIMSGGLGNLTKEIWTEPEADKFAKIAIQKGIPPSAILIENRSTNTGENIVFTQQLLVKRKKDPESFIVVQKPYMERRAYATFKMHMPEKNILVTSTQVSFDEYCTEQIPMEKVINIMVGDLQRIKLYPSKGYQVYQEIPERVWEAYEKLVAAGYSNHLIK